MQFKTLFFAGTMIAAVAAANAAQAFPYISAQDSAIAAAASVDANGFSNKTDNAYLEANRQLKSAGAAGLDKDLNLSKALSDLSEIAATGQFSAKSRGGWTAFANGSNWTGNFEDSGITLSNLMRTKRFDPLIKTYGQLQQPRVAAQAVEVVDYSNPATGILQLIKTVFSAVQTGVGNTVSLLRGIGSDQMPA